LISSKAPYPPAFVFRKSKVTTELIKEYEEAGFFPSGDGRPPSDEETPSPEAYEIVVFRDFFVCGLKFPCDTFLPVICPSKTKSSESNKRKRKAFEDVSEAEIQAVSSLAKLGKKKSKKAMKKVVVVVVQRVPSALSDEEMMDEPRQTCFFSCLCCELRFGVRRGCTPSSENNFVDIGTFLDIVPESQAAPDVSCALASVEAV
jgi:hypothetical protein